MTRERYLQTTPLACQYFTNGNGEPENGPLVPLLGKGGEFPSATRNESHFQLHPAPNYDIAYTKRPRLEFYPS